jgi:hypothetical protein
VGVGGGRKKRGSRESEKGNREKGGRLGLGRLGGKERRRVGKNDEGEERGNGGIVNIRRWEEK